MVLGCQPEAGKDKSVAIQEEETPLSDQEEASQEVKNAEAIGEEIVAEQASAALEKSTPKVSTPVRAEESARSIPDAPPSIDRSAENIATRFTPPAGFERINSPKGSFTDFLQHLPLKPEGSKVYYYNGAIKENRGVYAAVIDMDIGKRDLQQCADAIMRLRGEYLWHQQQYDQIHFNFTNGFRADYGKWRQGYRVRINGNQTSWYQGAQPSTSYASFLKYMELVFGYAGTASLEKELASASLDNLQIGDIFIQGGFPGHAVIVVDLAKNKETGEQLFLLAQSYMPAQDIQVLQNPNNAGLSPWYEIPGGGRLVTPEWVFDPVNLRKF